MEQMFILYTLEFGKSKVYTVVTGEVYFMILREEFSTMFSVGEAHLVLI